MGVDTRFWGPSGWQLFHYIAFRSDRPHDLLRQMKDVLPCKFCRESTTQFVAEHPLKGDPGKWLYEIHNMVNHKLRTQCKDDPTVIDPGPDPSFEDVKRIYESMNVCDVLGRDFLFSVAMNYPEEPTDDDKAIQTKFMATLAETYPVKGVFKAPQLHSRKAYTKWMYAQLKTIAEKVHTAIPSYKGYVQRLKYYESGCDTKTYRGVTCRRTKSGGRTKTRDHRRTFRVSHANLLTSSE